jgi:hypothetical protein
VPRAADSTGPWRELLGEAVGGTEEHGVLRLRSPSAHFAQDDSASGLTSVYRSLNVDQSLNPLTSSDGKICELIVTTVGDPVGSESEARDRLGDSTQFGHSSGLDPLDDENIAFVIETSAVRTNKSAGRKSSGALIAHRTPFLLGIFAFAEGGDHLVIAIENHNFAEKIGDDNISVALVQIARHLRRSRNAVPMFSVQAEALQAAVAAVGHDEQRDVST